MEQAEQVAIKNAAKMTGYTQEPAATTGYFWVKRPRGTGKYLTSVIAAYCDCPFHVVNGVCKHRVWLKEDLAWEARHLAEREAEEDAHWEWQDAQNEEAEKRFDAGCWR